MRNPFLSDPELFVRDPDFREHINLDAEDFAAQLASNAFAEGFTEAALDRRPPAQPDAQRAVRTRPCR